MNLLTEKPFLARPVIHILRPLDRITSSELGCIEYTTTLWNLGIHGFPVLVKDQMEKIITNNPNPHVCFMGQSNVGKSTMINSLLNQHRVNKMDCNTQKQRGLGNGVSRNIQSAERAIERGSFIPQFEKDAARRSMEENQESEATEKMKNTYSSQSNRFSFHSESKSSSNSSSQQPVPGASTEAPNPQIIRAIPTMAQLREYQLKKSDTSNNNSFSSSNQNQNLQSSESESDQQYRNFQNHPHAPNPQRLISQRQKKVVSPDVASLYSLNNHLGSNSNSNSNRTGTYINTRRNFSFARERAMAKTNQRIQQHIAKREKVKAGELAKPARSDVASPIAQKRKLKHVRSELKLRIKDSNIQMENDTCYGFRTKLDASIDAYLKTDKQSHAQAVELAKNQRKVKGRTTEGLKTSEIVSAKRMQLMQKNIQYEHKRTRDIQSVLDATEEPSRKSLGSRKKNNINQQHDRHRSPYKDDDLGVRSLDPEHIRDSHYEAALQSRNTTREQERLKAKDTQLDPHGHRRKKIRLADPDEEQENRNKRGLNGLIKGKRLFQEPTFAPISATPGRTRHLFRFEIGGRLQLIDLPGYGFAAHCPQSIQDEWSGMMDSYLEYSNKKTKRLKRIVSLIDVNTGFSDKDEGLWKMAIENKVTLQVVLTKCDLVRPWTLHNSMEHMIRLCEQVNKDVQGNSSADNKNKGGTNRNKVTTNFSNRYNDININEDDEEPYVPIYPYIHAVSALHDIGMQELRVSLASIARDEENLIKMEKMM